MCPAGAGGTARLRQCLGGSSKHQAESGSLALRSGRLASGCSPPRLAATQLPSASQPFRVVLWIGLSPSVCWYVQAHQANREAVLHSSSPGCSEERAEPRVRQNIIGDVPAP